MVRLTTQAPDPGQPRTASPAQIRANTAIGEGLAGAASLLGTTARDTSSELALARFEQGVGKDRAVAESLVEQIDLGLAALGESALASKEVQEAQRIASKLDQVDLAKPSSARSQVERLKSARRLIAQNPLAGPEIGAALGLTGGGLDTQLETLFAEVDREATTVIAAVEEYRQKFPSKAANMTQQEIMHAVSKQAEFVQNSENLRRKRENLQNMFLIETNAQRESIAVTDLESDELEARNRLTRVRAVNRLLQEEDLQSQTVAQLQYDAALEGYDPNMENASQYVRDSLSSYRLALNERREEVRKMLPGASADEVERHIAYETGLLEAMEDHFENRIGAIALNNYAEMIETGAALDLHNRIPGYTKGKVIAKDFIQYYPDDWMSATELDRSFAPFMQHILSELGGLTESDQNRDVQPGIARRRRRAGGVTGPETQTFMGVMENYMTRDQAVTALKDQTEFLLNAMSDVDNMESEDLQTLNNIFRATMYSANGRRRGGDVDIEAMNALLPLLKHPKAIDMMDQDLKDAWETNFPHYVQAMAQSIGSDLSEILGTQINIEGIPPLLGVADDLIPTAEEFTDVKIEGEDASKIIHEIGYDVMVTDSGRVVISPKTGERFNLKNEGALRFLDKFDQYLTTWRTTYEPKIAAISQYLGATQSKFTPKQIATMMLHGKTPFDVEELPQADAES